MKIKLTDIEARVYSLLDENIEIFEERMEYCDPHTSIRGLILDLLEDAARVVLASVPVSRIDECSHYTPGFSAIEESGVEVMSAPGAQDSMPSDAVMITGNVAFDSDGIGHLDLPDGFLRLLYFRMSDWKGGVTTPLASGGEEYMLRRKIYRGQRGTRIRPAVGVEWRGDKSRLEIFGSQPGASIVNFDYVAAPRINGLYIDIPRGLVGDVCAKVAEMVEAVLEI